MKLQTSTKNLINCCISVVTGKHMPVTVSDFESFYRFGLAHKLENLAYLHLS